jgi:hypothetical protein
MDLAFTEIATTARAALQALRPDRTGRADGQIRRRPYGSGAPIHPCSSRAKSSFWVARISRTNDLAHCSQKDLADS